MKEGKEREKKGEKDSKEREEKGDGEDGGDEKRTGNEWGMTVSGMDDG